ncbi:MAG: response regulator [Anaerolineae bacterium]|nr:response regulator [Gloeobacterales cyanobacterium ES-bin-313]
MRSVPSTASFDAAYNPGVAGRATIFIVEDESMIAEDLSECLTELGYRVVGITNTGKQAIKQVLALLPDLVLMDINLKGTMNGIEAAIAIRTQLDVPVVFLTAFSDEYLLKQAQLTMAYGYLVKPYKERELRAALQMALYKHHFDREVSENQQWMHAILRGIGDGVIASDIQGKITFINKAAESLTGFKSVEALGRRVSEILNLFHPLDHESARHPLETALIEKRTVFITKGTLLVRKDSSHLPVCDSCAPVFDQHQRLLGAVCIFHDDKARLHEEQRLLSNEHTRQLEVQVAELQKLDRLKEDFLSTVSHEMRTPLASMKLALKLLQNTQNEEARARYIAILQAQTDRELSLVNALLDVQNLERALDLPQESIDLLEWLPPIVDPFRAQAAQNGLVFTLDLGEGIPMLRTCPALLEQAICELLYNACKYTPPEGDILLRAKPFSSGSDEKPFLELSFVNTSNPIAEQELIHLFDKFYRVPNNDPWKYGGTGLGLSLVKRLVEQLQGRISVENAGEGRIAFIIELPFAPNLPDD